MTTPAPQQPSQGQQNAALALAAATALAGATTVAGMVAALGTMAVAAGIELAALNAAIDVVMSMPGDRAGFYGPATARISRLNLIRRAQFLVASAHRLTADVRLARSQGTPLVDALRDGITHERRYYGEHLTASWTRENAAAQVDSTSMTYGRLLGWNTVLDSHTSPECRAANRRNFWADDMPSIGYPGAVHPHCRCFPGAPFPGAPLVGAGRRVYGRAA
jgi:hypothetical protein